MPALTLGPILRHIGETDATIWLEADRRCQVEVLGRRSQTFEVEGHHYALVELTDLEPSAEYPYEVRLDGELAWPEPESSLPASTIRTLAPGRRARIAFGSCRVSLPHEPPYVLVPSEHPSGQGVDALRALALELSRSDREELPECLLMLGDQIYADDLSPQMCEVTRRRGERGGSPVDELSGFEEYALAYREAWSEPNIRWLLSTVPTAMVFDDHEIHAQWKISQPWLDAMRRRPWYDDHVTAGLMTYWVYQQIGNLSPAELADDQLYGKVRERGGSILREEMRNADRQPGHSRWSYCRDLGDTRLVVIDSRAGRVLEPDRRQMIDAGEWEWIRDRVTGDFRYLVLASSVPFFLSPGLQHAESIVETIGAGGWGRLAVRGAEWIRRKAVMDHWASFPRSFDTLALLLEELASGRRGSPPQAIVLLSGDVHHCYLAEIGFRAGAGASVPVWQAVCSAYRKALSPGEKLMMRFGNSGFADLLGRRIARLIGADSPRIGWRMHRRPRYDNQVGLLELGPSRAEVSVQTTAGSDWRNPRLRAVFRERLA